MADTWHVIDCTHPETAKLSIQKLGFEAFAPECVIRVRHARTAKLVRRPLLYNYIFARFDLTHERWKLIARARGVDSVMPGRVSDLEFQRVRTLAGQYDRIVCEQIPLTKDQAVIIIEGAFADRVGKIRSAEPDKDTVVVDCEILGGWVPVIVSRGCVAPAA